MESTPKVTEQSQPSFKEKFLNHTSQFGFEYFMSLVSILVTASFIAYALFAIANYAYGYNSEYSSRFFGEASLWIAAAMIVWLPVTMFFYLRSQGEVDRNVAIRGRGLMKLLTAIFLFFSITAAIVFAFTAVFVALRMLVGIDDLDSLSEGLVRVVIPAVLSSALFGALSLNWLRAQLMSRKTFAVLFSGAAIILTVVILVLSVVSVRGYAQDQKKENAISEISSNLQSYHSENGKLPPALTNLSGLGDKTKNQLGNIEYKRESDDRYQLCATFSMDTKHGERALYSYNNDYQPYQSVSEHDAGKQCFKYTAGTFGYDDYLYDGSGETKREPTIDSQMN
jgi:hypothetical protein